MTRRHPAFTSLLAIATSLLLIANLQAQTTSSRSLQVGIQRTQTELQQIDEMLKENLAEAHLIATDMGVAGAGLLSENFGPLVEALTAMYGSARDIHEAVSAHYDPNTSKWLALSNDVQVLIGLAGVVYKPAGLLDALYQIKLANAQLEALSVQRQQLLSVRQQLATSLGKLLLKDPENLQRIQAASTEAQKQFHAQLISLDELMKQYYKDRPNEIQLAVKNAADRSPQTAANVGAGIQIVDPDQSLWDLSKIPGINPDFLRALATCKRWENLWFNCGLCRQYYAQVMTCNKNPDGSFVAAFGPVRTPSDNDKKNDCSEYYALVKTATNCNHKSGRMCEQLHGFGSGFSPDEHEL